MDQLIIIGAGALGREVLVIASDARGAGAAFEVKGFLDKNPSALDSNGAGFPVLGSERDYVIQPEDRFVMALGDPITRDQVACDLEQRGARFISLVHPTAIVVDQAEIADGCVLAQNTFVALNARLDSHVFLNTYASVGHDCVVGRSSVLAPGAVVNGDAVLGESVLIGSNAVVTAGRRLGDRARLGAASVAYRNIAEDCLALGNPAKSKKVSRG